jgi:hypothetical protein
MIGYKRVTTEEELRRKDLFFWSDGHRCSSSCSDGTYIEVRPSDSAADALSVPASDAGLAPFVCGELSKYLNSNTRIITKASISIPTIKPTITNVYQRIDVMTDMIGSL